MKYNLKNETLKLILDGLGEDYKDMLLDKAMLEAGKSDADNLSTADLIKLDMKIKAALSTDQKDEGQATPTSSGLEITNMYRELESIIYQLVPSGKRLSFGNILTYLESVHILDAHDINIFIKLSQLRNEFVHGQKDISADKAGIILKESNNIIQKLKKLLP